MTADDDVLTAIMAVELAAKAPMELVLRPLTALQLTGLIQLALRHPQVSTHLRNTAATFIHGIEAFFADCPMTLDVVRRGNDPGEDLDWR
jgi:hypothetical protein